ncbi:Succinylglutamate desuccinylase / Aspartoacylase family [Fragilaria crotonensis]|nr:Succinylglutamate desuccinylase / Aspartoacylase family [Fragilaria crotonensis]
MRICSLYAIFALVPATASSLNTVRNIAIVGGTHGNEYTGVWCIRELDAAPLTCYPSLHIKTLLGNPEAHFQNKRFIDDDLNRQFTAQKLMEQTNTVEARRARELNQLLGPKSNPKTDVIIDLHTTTTNMGTTLIVPAGDSFMTQAAAYVVSKFPEARILVHNLGDRDQRPNLCSTARHGLTIEVGPVPQGVLRHDAVENTKRALHAFLEFLERTNHGDGATVLAELKEVYPSGHVPCFQSASAKHPGELSGRIKWPSCAYNINFPAYMVHKSIQDRDFCMIRTGDPLFVGRDGSVITYNGSHGDEVYLMFVNEGGYYYASSGTGIGVAVPKTFDLLTGHFSN